MEKKILCTLLSIILVMSSIFFVSGCKTASANYKHLLSNINAENLMSHVKAEDVDTIDLAEHNAAVTDFAVRLFQGSLNTQKNTLISPLSVLSALSMTANGADAETLSQMEETFGLSAEELNQYLYTYMEQLPQDKNNKLLLANSIWFIDDERFTVNEEFLQTNAAYYGADVYKAPFDDTTLNDINTWVKAKTEGKIPKMLDNLSDEAVMYLVNALSFNAKWKEVYTDVQVYEKTFRNLDGTETTADMLYSDEHLYFEEEQASGFIKYYEDENYAFAALLPNEGVDIFEYISTLDGEHLHDLISHPQSFLVYAAIPKFESEYDVEMSNILKNLGINDAFDGELADFSSLGSSSAGNIFISRVLHKTFISVSEEGTEAGAATVVEMADGAAEAIPEHKTVYLDRPFIYMLIDCQNNVPFFIGTVLELEP